MKLKSNKIVSLNSSISSVTKSSDDSDDLIIEGYANTTDKDRAGDVIVRSAWETKNALTNYLKNPVILAFHDHSRPVGRMIEHEVTDQGLRIKAKISKAAGEIYQLIQDEVITAFSVGFRVLDADYDTATDIFLIKDLELHETSVVSVPMNQTSIFSISKSFDTDEEVAEFKSLYTTNKSVSENDHPNEEILMNEQELKALIEATLKTNNAEVERARLEAEEKAAKEKAAAERDEVRIGVMVKSQTERLLADLEKSQKEGAEAFAKQVALLQTDIKSKDEEIRSILAARDNKMHYGDESAKSAFTSKEIEDAYILAKVCKKDLFDTKFGRKLSEKAVNASSSGQVSSDKYEQEVTSRLYESMKEMLTVQPLFREIQLNSATQILPINPNSTSAGWVDGANYGAAASTGAELTKALTEITLNTFKLAGKSYITDETDEDAIIPILPLLRDQLVEAHSLAIDSAFISGSGVANNPTGLITRAIATAGSAVSVTTAKADGSVKVTAKMLLQARRGLGQWGLSMKDLALVVSMDAYWDLLEDTEFQNINEVGAMATKKTGQVGMVYGMPVMVSTQMPTKAVNAAYAIIVNTKNFVAPRLRGFNIQSDYDVEKQRRVIVSTQRLGFNDIIANQGVAIATYAAA